MESILGVTGQTCIGCWLGLSHSTLRKGTSYEKKKILFKAIHSWKSWASFIFWKWVIGLLSIESIKLKPLSIEILLEHLCSMMKINRWNGYIFSPLSAKIYWKRQIHKQIIRLSALRICEYSEVKPKGGEDWGVYGYMCVCTCVLLFFPITGISFKKPYESAIKQRSSEYASGNITQGWGLHCTAIE